MAAAIPSLRIGRPMDREFETASQSVSRRKDRLNHPILQPRAPSDGPSPTFAQAGLAPGPEPCLDRSSVPYTLRRARPVVRPTQLI